MITHKTLRALRRLRAGWITVGENDLHLQVDDKGSITKGPPSLKGDGVHTLSDRTKNDVRSAKRDHAKAEGKTGRDYSTREAQSLGNDKRVAQHQAAKSAAQYPRIATHEVIRHMREAHQFVSSQIAEREAAKEHARKLSGLNAGNIAKLENTYHDHSTVAGFDHISRELAHERPELGFDPDSTETPGKVWDLIREGKREAPALHSRDVAEQAAQWLRESRKSQRVNSPPVGDAFDDFDIPASTPSKHPSGKRSKEVIPFARGNSRTRLLSSLAMGRQTKPEIVAAPARSSMRFAEGNVKLRASGGKDKTFREFTGSAYNGGVMYPSITANGVTQTMAIVLDLDTLTIPQPERPVLDDHDESTDGVIGQTTMLAVRKSDYTLPVAGVLYTRKDRSKKILQASDGGHRWQLSVGTDNFDIERVPAGQSVRVNQRTFHGPVAVARNAYLTDLSFVAVGGDDTTYAVIAAGRGGRRAEQ